MEYNFDEIINRENTDAVKIEIMKKVWGREDLLPMWVADMDFRTPPFIIETLKKRCEHEILGYTCIPDAWYDAIRNWLENRYQWKIKNEWLGFVPGIVPGLAFAVQCFTDPGDRILIQTPVYHPFSFIIKNNGRELVNNSLILENDHYRMDLEGFRRIIKGCKLFILCNPHNPGGVVWTKEELEIIADVCYENHVLVLSDEIHADLTLPPYRHGPFAMVSKKAAINSITFMSPSKAFNMAGLGSSYFVIENEEIRKKFETYLEGSELANGHLFAFIGVVAAYTHGTEWLEQLLSYIKGNIDYVDEYLKREMPEIKIIRPQASFLIFLDCRLLKLTQSDLIDLFVEGAHLALNEGTMFGNEGTGFMRMNIACPRSVLHKALEQLKKAYRESNY